MRPGSRRLEPAKATAALLTAMLLAACAQPVQPSVGARASVPVSFAALMPGDVLRDAKHVGQRVRWGGGLDRVRVEAGRTCFHMRAAGLDAEGVPVHWNRPADDRFVACIHGRFDERLLAPYTHLSFTGRIVGVTGSGMPRQALLAADTVLRWSDCLDTAAHTDPACRSGPLQALN